VNWMRVVILGYGVEGSGLSGCVFIGKQNRRTFSLYGSVNEPESIRSERIRLIATLPSPMSGRPTGNR
jgi:hypothetical protein